MLNELKEDKQKLEENILELLKEFNKKYPEIIIEDINLVHRVRERNLQGTIVINEIAKLILDLKI